MLPGRRYSRSAKTPLRWHHSGSGQQSQAPCLSRHEQDSEIVGSGGGAMPSLKTLFTRLALFQLACRNAESAGGGLGSSFPAVVESVAGFEVRPTSNP